MRLKYIIQVGNNNKIIIPFKIVTKSENPNEVLKEI